MVAKDSFHISRRSFLYYLGIAGVLVQFPLTACKRFVKPSLFEFGEEEKEILRAVLDHLLPHSENAPGALDVNALQHLESVIKDPYLKASKRKLIKAGIQWTIDTSKDNYGKSFTKLTVEEREMVLRNVESLDKGQRWLSTLLSYIFEALLGDPVYGINTGEAGWKWLKHVPGYPRPVAENMYKN